MTDEIKVKDKDIVVPGETIANGMSFLPGKGTYRADERIVAQQLGMVSVDGKVIKLIRLSGAYSPRVNDKVIGRVFDVLMSGWRIDINCPYSAVMMLKEASSSYIEKGSDLTQYFAIDDYVLGKIVNVTSQRLIDLSMKGPGLQKLKGGRVIKVSPQKVPRIIGKDGSMVTLLKKETGCSIVVGQNGLIWMKGEPAQEVLAEKAIRKIEEEAHLPGLTEQMAKFFKEAGK